MQTAKNYLSSLKRYKEIIGNSAITSENNNSPIGEITEKCRESNLKLFGYNSTNPNIIIVGTRFSKKKTEEEENIANFMKLSIKKHDKIFFTHSKEGIIDKYDPLLPTYIRSIADKLRENIVELNSVGNPTTHYQAIQKANSAFKKSHLNKSNNDISKIKNAYQELEEMFLNSKYGLIQNMQDSKNYLILPALILLIGETVPILENKSLEYCIVTRN